VAEKNYVTYDINFTVAGDYLLYQRIGGFHGTLTGKAVATVCGLSRNPAAPTADSCEWKTGSDDPEFEDDDVSSEAIPLVKEWEWFYIDEGQSDSGDPGRSGRRRAEFIRLRL
jgi:hypothetical protein